MNTFLVLNSKSTSAKLGPLSLMLPPPDNLTLLVGKSTLNLALMYNPTSSYTGMLNAPSNDPRYLDMLDHASSSLLETTSGRNYLCAIAIVVNAKVAKKAVVLTNLILFYY
jgi:hypothetical protein